MTMPPLVKNSIIESVLFSQPDKGNELEIEPDKGNNNTDIDTDTDADALDTGGIADKNDSSYSMEAVKGKVSNVWFD